MTKKPLGRSSSSLNAPIAAFTMAVVLCSYCIYSINSARRGRGAQSQSLAQSPDQVVSQASSSLVQKRQQQRQTQRTQGEWVRRVLEERDLDGGGSGGAGGGSGL